MKSKFSAIFALALTAMLLAVPFVGGGESDAAGTPEYSVGMSDSELVTFVQTESNKGKVLSFEGDSNRTLTMTGSSMYPNLELAGKTITIKNLCSSSKHVINYYGTSINGGTPDAKGTIIFDPVISSTCTHTDFRGFGSEASEVVYSNLNVQWSSDKGGMLIRSGKADATIDNVHFGSDSTQTGIGFYLSGNNKDITIKNCSFTNCSTPVGVNNYADDESITVIGECPEIYVSVADESQLQEFMSKVTTNQGEELNLMVTLPGYTEPKPLDQVIPPVTYTISFNISSVSPITVEAGTTVVLPDLPEKNGYKSVGWAYNGTLVGYMFTVSDSDVALTACYEPIPGSSQTVIEEASLGTDDIVVIAMCVLALLVLGFLFFIIKTS